MEREKVPLAWRNPRTRKPHGEGGEGNVRRKGSEGGGTTREEKLVNVKERKFKGIEKWKGIGGKGLGEPEEGREDMGWGGFCQTIA